MNWWDQLDNSRGSRPRCVLLMEGSRKKVADRLTRIVNLPKVKVSSNDKWMPYGKPILVEDGLWDNSPAKELKFDQPNELITKNLQNKMKRWWLEVFNRANTPNWDIASTCKVNGQYGLILVEAKAHKNELSDSGKSLPKTDNGWKNHRKIGRAIADAAAGFQELTSKRTWNISRDHHYQLSNRFAWSWKLASHGVPVVFVYLGFLNAYDIAEDGLLLKDDSDWHRAVLAYSKGVIDKSFWNKPSDLNGTRISFLIRTFEMPFERHALAAER